MNITVNGDPKEYAEGTTVRAMLESLGLGDTLVAVERNREIVPRATYGEAQLQDGDTVEVVHFVGGG